MSKRVIGIDMIKAICCFMVICIHCSISDLCTWGDI